MSYGQERRSYNNGGNNNRGGRDRQTHQPATVTGEPEKVTVKWYNSEKGYGFVVTENKQDLFIHASVLKTAGMDVLEEGQELVIRRGPGRKAGTEAANEIVV